MCLGGNSKTELLIMYISRKYEENAIFDEWHLFEEYKLLERNNELNDTNIGQWKHEWLRMTRLVYKVHKVCKVIKFIK